METETSQQCHGQEFFELGCYHTCWSKRNRLLNTYKVNNGIINKSSKSTLIPLSKFKEIFTKEGDNVAFTFLNAIINAERDTRQKNMNLAYHIKKSSTAFQISFHFQFVKRDEKYLWICLVNDGKEINEPQKCYIDFQRMSTSIIMYQRQFMVL
uniref:MULE transposase domain-containing protein n=1 Tax=Strongyloides venezuelensis TaxID=75913 RepID=A0A0K0FEF4_STRVS